MATVNFTLLPSITLTLTRAKWTPLAYDAGTSTGDVGSALNMADFPDRSVQVLGPFGSGGSVTIQGSNDDGTTWATLRDPQGNNLTFTSAGLKAILELPQYIRPAVTAGDAATAIEVFVHMRGRDQ